MPVYDYTALDSKGKTVSGIIDAEGVAAARQKIRAAGNYPVDIRPIGDQADRHIKSRSGVLASVFGRIRPVEVAVMTRQLATLISAGFPLVTALDSLVEQVHSKAFKKIIAGIKDALVEGSSFADALAKYPQVFSQLYVNMVRAGETSGTLEIVLLRLADITESHQALKARIQTAMLYPIIMTAAGSLILFFLFIYVIPNITSIFEDVHQVLPLPTRMLIATSELVKSFWWVGLAMTLILAAAFRAALKTGKGRAMYDRAKLRLPVFGAITSKAAVARLARTLGSLLDNGVSMLPALQIVENIVGNTLLAEAIKDAGANVSKGQSLAAALDAAHLLPSLAIQMIQVGEQSGELEKMLYKIADIYEKEVETTIMRLTALLEPVMVLVMAGAVLFIVLSICLPIFEMNTLIG